MKKTLRTLSLVIALGGIGLTAFASGSLSDVFTIKDADATCCSTVINNGNCSFTERCVPDAGSSSVDCDSTKGNCESAIEQTIN